MSPFCTPGLRTEISPLWRFCCGLACHLFSWAVGFHFSCLLSRSRPTFPLCLTIRKGTGRERKKGEPTGSAAVPRPTQQLHCELMEIQGSEEVGGDVWISRDCCSPAEMVKRRAQGCVISYEIMQPYTHFLSQSAVVLLPR